MVALAPCDSLNETEMKQNEKYLSSFAVATLETLSSHVSTRLPSRTVQLQNISIVARLALELV